MSYGLLQEGRNQSWDIDEATNEALVVQRQKALRYDSVTSATSYLGTALVGSATSAAAWRIQRLSFSGGDVTIEFADGDAEFDNVWDNRASLSYS